jgi:hypothetical protein
MLTTTPNGDTVSNPVRIDSDPGEECGNGRSAGAAELT